MTYFLFKIIMTKDEVMFELSKFGNEQTKKVFTMHGTREELQYWAKNAYWYMLSEYTVPWLAAESQYGWELALEWIESTEEGIASTSWSTLSNLVSLRSDEELDQDRLLQLLNQVARRIHQSQNRVRYTMNGFVIAVGSYIEALNNKANEVATSIGKKKKSARC